jgi:hypothetical protein
LIEQNETQESLNELYKKFPKTSDGLYKKTVEFRLNCSEDDFNTLNKAMGVSFKHNHFLCEYAP